MSLYLWLRRCQGNTHCGRPRKGAGPVVSLQAIVLQPAAPLRCRPCDRGCIPPSLRHSHRCRPRSVSALDDRPSWAGRLPSTGPLPGLLPLASGRAGRPSGSRLARGGHPSAGAASVGARGPCQTAWARRTTPMVGERTTPEAGPTAGQGARVPLPALAAAWMVEAPATADLGTGTGAVRAATHIATGTGIPGSATAAERRQRARRSAGACCRRWWSATGPSERRTLAGTGIDTRCVPT